MGSWGLGSDENDDTYNAMGFGIFERFGGVSFKDESLPEVSKIYSEDVFPQADGIAFLGSVVFALRHRLTVEEKWLNKAKEQIIAERESDTCEENRKEILEEELSEINSALRNNGRSQKGTSSKTLGDRFAEEGQSNEKS